MHSAEEMALTLDVSIAIVKARLHRARKRLAQFSVSENGARRRPNLHCQRFVFGLQNREEPCRNRR